MWGYPLVCVSLLYLHSLYILPSFSLYQFMVSQRFSKEETRGEDRKRKIFITENKSIEQNHSFLSPLLLVIVVIFI